MLYVGKEAPRLWAAGVVFGLLALCACSVNGGSLSAFVTRHQPGRLTISGAGSVKLFVTNLPNAITEYDQNGNQITQSGTFPNLNQPLGITFDSSNGDLYVIDHGFNTSGNNTITEYDQNGNLLNTFSAPFPTLFDPTGIAFDSSNNNLYVVNGSSTITEYDQNLNPITTFGSFPTPLNGPAGIAFDSLNGHLYVVNNGNNTIVEFDQNGNLITTSGTFPKLDLPVGIAFDVANGHLYVTNLGCPSPHTPPRITEYDQNGNLIVIPSGTFPNLNGPTGISFDSANDHLYVTNSSNNTITEYDQDGNRISTSGTFVGLHFPSSLTVAP